MDERFRHPHFTLSLALSVHALGAVRGWKKGITFATTQNNASKQFLPVGEYKLPFMNSPLPEFYCANHQANGQAIGLEIYQVPRPIFKDVIREIQTELETKMTFDATKGLK